MKKIIFLISLFVLLVVVLFTNWSTYECLSVGLFTYFMFSFVTDLGKKLIILEIAILLSILTCLVLPIGGYHHYNATNKLARGWVYFMRVPSEQYYSFMFPSVITMIIGMKLPLFCQKAVFQVHKQYIINAKAYVINMKWQGLILVAVGIVASFLQVYAPESLSTIFTFLKYLIFVGVFYCVYADIPKKQLVLFLVFGMLIYRSLATAMFGELIFMSAMTLILLMLGKKITLFTKLSLLLVGIVGILVLQVVKPVFRKRLMSPQNTEGRLSLFSNIAQEKLSDPSTLVNDEKVMFALYVRLNQGNIISRVINAVPARYPYANGETIALSVAATLVPRFLWPDKPSTGGAAGFERFLGFKLKGYSMGLSPFGEAYGNFGKTGGIIFMFFFGLLYNFLFSHVMKLAVKIPSLVFWFPFLFLYAVNIETDIVSMLNSFTKAALFTYFLYKVFPVIVKIRL